MHTENAEWNEKRLQAFSIKRLYDFEWLRENCFSSKLCEISFFLWRCSNGIWIGKTQVPFFCRRTSLELRKHFVDFWRTIKGYWLKIAFGLVLNDFLFFSKFCSRLLRPNIESFTQLDVHSFTSQMIFSFVEI